MQNRLCNIEINWETLFLLTTDLIQLILKKKSGFTLFRLSI